MNVVLFINYYFSKIQNFFNLLHYHLVSFITLSPFFIISVGVLCEFAMMPGVYILLSSQKEEVHSSS